MKKAYELASIPQAANLCVMVQFLDHAKESMQISDENMKMLIRRTKVVADDAIERMERLAPEWLPSE